MRFTVIIPLYNKEEFINETLQSLVAQTKLPYEIIIVDDCSTDGSLEKVAAFLERAPSYFNTIRIEIIALKKNFGPGYARNIGAKKAKGDIISFLDADDLYKPKLLEKIELFTTHLNIGFIVVGIQLFPSGETYPEIDEINVFIKKLSPNFYKLEKPLDVVISPSFVMGAGSNVFVKREWIEQIYYHDSVRMNEGNDFWYRVMRNAMKDQTSCFGLLTGNYIQVREVRGSLSRRKYDNWTDIDVPPVYIRYKKSPDKYDRLLSGLICSRWLPNSIQNLTSFKQKTLFVFNHMAVFWHIIQYHLNKIKT